MRAGFALVVLFAILSLPSHAWAANNLSLNFSASTGVTTTVAGGTTTFTSTSATGNLNWQDVDNALSVGSVNIVASGDITDSTGAQLGGVLSGDTLSIDAGGVLTLTYVATKASGGTIIHLNGTTSSNIHAIAGQGGPITITGGPITLGTVNVVITPSYAGIGSLSLTSSGLIASTSVIQATSLTGSSAGATTLTGANVVGSLGAFTAGGDFSFTNTQSMSVNPAPTANGGAGNITLTTTGASDLDIADDLISAQTLTLVAGKHLTQTAGSIVANTLTGSSGGSTILSSAGNSIAVLGNFGAQGFTLNDATALVLGHAFTYGFAVSPAAGTVVQLISAPSVGGSFSSLTASNLSPGESVTALYASGSTSLRVNGPATHFSVAAPASATAGTALGGVIVTALDTFGNIAAGYTGIVHFTSTDGAAVLPADATLSGGAGTFSVTLKTAGSQTLTATDTLSSSITGTSNPINVSAAAANHYAVVAPANATVGMAFGGITVAALDAFNNIVTGYIGIVHFTSTDAAATLPANAVLTNGTGSFTGTLHAAGTQTITATDTVSAGITGTSNSILVGKVSTTSTVNVPSAISLGTSAMVSATVVSTGGTPTGTVTITDSTDSLSCSYLLSAPTPGCTLTPATAGSKTLTASYSGDANFLSSSSASSVTLTVNPAQPGSVVSSSVNPSVFGQPVALTATVTAPGGGVVPTSNGSNVHFLFDGSEICAGSALTSGSGSSATAACAIPQASLAVGNHTVQFHYDGDTNNAASSAGTLTQNVVRDITTITLTASPSSITVGQTVTLTATVFGDPPTGAVTFFDGATTRGNVTLTVTSPTSATATFSTNALGIGTHTLSATFGGDQNNEASASAIVSVTVSPGQPEPAPALGTWAMLMLCVLIAAVARPRAWRQ